MQKRFLLAILVPCTFCAGQSVLITPLGATQSSSANTAGAAPAGVQTQPQTPPQLGHNPAFNTEIPATAFSQTRVAEPLALRSDFERYAEEAAGHPLAVFGRQLFDAVPTTFAPVENVPVPADYVLGPGDELIIRAWGKITLDSRETVDRNGQINLPRVGTMTVAGLRYSQLEGYLHLTIGALFKDFELNVALGQLRSIQIYVLGDARRPGAYTVSSLSTLVDALFTSGGPSATGTMRRIELRRTGQASTKFDIYDLIEKGDKSHDIRLLPGDVIFIPSIGAQIAIDGDVNRPGIYELKEETTVGAALMTAGQITSVADTERAVLERIKSHSGREVDEFSLDAAGQSRLVKDGDLLRVFPLSPKFSNAVTLRGSVAQPGLYSWKEGMRISELIPSRAFLITRGYWNRQNHLIRPEPDSPFANQLMDADGAPRIDPVGNPKTDGYGTQGTNTLGGTNPDASKNPRADRARDVDSGTVASIGRNSAEINWEYALIERLDEHDLSTRLIPFNLGTAIGNPTAIDNQQLKPGDVVTIFSSADLELPMEKHASFVQVGGEVQAPGVYRVNPGDTLRDLVEMAGGLTGHSYLYASIFSRVSTRIAQEAQLRESAEEMQKELVTKYANATPQAGQNTADQQALLALQQESLIRFTSIRPTGRVILNIKPESSRAADIPDFQLEDGDSFYIPPRLGTVQVTGAVYNANAFRYVSGERLINYLTDAGGATRQADQKRIFLIRADGTVVSRQSRTIHSHGRFENLKLLPGDAIVVPVRLRTSSPLNAFQGASQLASQAALTAAALSIIK